MIHNNMNRFPGKRPFQYALSREIRIIGKQYRIQKPVKKRKLKLL
jgi:hypothetical protein